MKDYSLLDIELRGQVRASYAAALRGDFREAARVTWEAEQTVLALRSAYEALATDRIQDDYEYTQATEDKH